MRTPSETSIKTLDPRARDARELAAAGWLWDTFEGLE